MTRCIRLLLLTQLLTFVLGLAVVAHAQLTPAPTFSTGSVTSALPATVAAAAVKPARRPVTRPLVVPARKAVRRSHVRRHHVTQASRPQRAPVAPRLAASTALQRMDQAIARIPGYPAGGATWVLVAKDGYWGTADWYHNVVYVSPSVPANRIYDVVAHEWSHLLEVKVYSGDVDKTMAALNSYYGGSEVDGAEKAADCMARKLGATWTHYTACTDTSWQAGAAQLLAGHQL